MWRDEIDQRTISRNAPHLSSDRMNFAKMFDRVLAANKGKRIRIQRPRRLINVVNEVDEWTRKLIQPDRIGQSMVAAADIKFIR